MAHAILKLVSGETIIADVTNSIKENHINVTDPLIVRTGMDEDNRLVMSMYKWIDTAQTNFTIDDDHIILRAAPSEYLIEYYNEAKEDVDLLSDDEDMSVDQFEEGYSTAVH